MRMISKIAHQILSSVRSRSATRVFWTPDTGIGLGNMLDLWLYADPSDSTSKRVLVRRTPAMERWLHCFPRLNELTIRNEQISLWFDREVGVYSRDPNLLRPVLDHFIREYLLSAPILAQRPPAPLDVVTVNVRRGDYYSNPKWSPLYGFDITSYVKIAAIEALQQGPVAKFAVVSDDPVWCRMNLDFLADLAPISFQHDTDGPEENFAQLCTAPRLILANSSFSYWAAYVSNVLHGDNHSMTWAPWFHRRDLRNGAAWQLDSRWSIVHDIPGGW